MEFFQAFGIGIKNTIAQLVTFLILLGILYKYAYKPIFTFVQDRTARIEKGVKDAQAARQALEKAQTDQEKILSDARKESIQIIKESREQAESQSTQLLEKAKKDVADVVMQGKKTIEQDKKRMIEEVKVEIIDLVIASTRKILDKAVTREVDKKWLKEQLDKK